MFLDCHKSLMSWLLPETPVHQSTNLPDDLNFTSDLWLWSGCLMTSGQRTSSQLLLKCSWPPLELILGSWCIKYPNIIANLGWLGSFFCFFLWHLQIWWVNCWSCIVVQLFQVYTLCLDIICGMWFLYLKIILSCPPNCKNKQKIVYSGKPRT